MNASNPRVKIYIGVVGNKRDVEMRMSELFTLFEMMEFKPVYSHRNIRLDVLYITFRGCYERVHIEAMRFHNLIAVRNDNAELWDFAKTRLFPK